MVNKNSILFTLYVHIMERTHLPRRVTVNLLTVSSLLSNTVFKSRKRWCIVHASKKGASMGVGSHKSKDEAPVQIVTPSVWVKADVQLSGILNTLRNSYGTELE